MRALVIGGGGTRSAFATGVLDELQHLGFGAKFFDYVVGSSSGGCQAAYFSTGQTKELVRAALKHLPENFVCSTYALPRVDIVWLERLFREIEPLSVSALRASRMRAYAMVSNISDKRIECVCLNEADDPVRVIVAGAAMAFFSPPVSWRSSLYCDGALGAPVPFREAIEADADEIWVVVNVPCGHRQSVAYSRAVSPFVSRHAYVRRLMRDGASEANAALDTLEQRTDWVVIRPTYERTISNRSRNKEELRMILAMGRAAAREVLRERQLVC